MSSEDKQESQFNISIGGNLSGNQIAIGNNIQQSVSQPEPAQKEDSETDSPEDAARQAVLTQLRQMIASLFSEEELRSLVFDLGLNYDSLPGRGLEAKARELVDLMARRQRLDALMQLLKRERPQADWPSELAE